MLHVHIHVILAMALLPPSGHWLLFILADFISYLFLLSLFIAVIETATSEYHINMPTTNMENNTDFVVK
jgi:TRAP-type C4-dicarboxylate transport system permease small subunit